MHSELDLNIKNDSKKHLKQHKSFSNRNAIVNLPPYCHEVIKAKQKAFERYKKIYPL